MPRPPLPFRNPHAAFRNAFTLLELLLVLAVIALLTALLLPAMSRARGAANQLTCTSHLRRWATAMQLYANQNQGWLPRRGQGIQPTTSFNRPEDWFNALPPLMRLRPLSQLIATHQPPRPADGSLFSCPSAVDDPSLPAFFSYAMNMRLSPWNSPTPHRITRVGPWSTLVVFADAPGPYSSTLPAPAKYSPIARHRNRVNIAYLDAHVTSYPADYVGCNQGDPQHPDLRWTIPFSAWTLPN